MDIPDTQNRQAEEVDTTLSASSRLHAVLQSLSLDEYTEALIAHGFTSWDEILEIQEHDLEALEFKLGHRRKLQREIAVYKNVTRPRNQHETPGDPTAVADVQSPVPRQGKRRLDQLVPFQGVHKRSRQMALRPLLSADPTALSSLTHFTVVKDHCSTISLQMPPMYGGNSAPISPNSYPTYAPHLLTEEAGINLKPVSGSRFLPPSSEQVDAWACSLLNLSPCGTQCDHTDSSCDCWRGDPITDEALYSAEPTSVLNDEGPPTNRNLTLSTAFPESSTSSSRSGSGSGSGSSTSNERHSAARTRETSYASAEDVQHFLNKPPAMPMQLQMLPENPTNKLILATCIYILPKMAGSNHQANLYFAVYLASHTLDDFIHLLANKCGMHSHQILRTVRVDERGAETAFTDTMVRAIRHEQTMAAEFRDIGLPPDLHPSSADAAGFAELKSKFFELRLVY
ncbi:hypothetical protein FKW77_003765 [Venturia effusa]|uniref:SAM domain-containing protein n=1 Tax=Venturia effusa TaxID=50376 RepID=A0A517L154_9PEZI|nr:hypothetical protein FKW77_003765 [Venturia effusa]